MLPGSYKAEARGGRGGGRGKSRGRGNKVSAKTKTAVSKYKGPTYKKGSWKTSQAAGSLYGIAYYQRTQMYKDHPDRGIYRPIVMSTSSHTKGTISGHFFPCISAHSVPCACMERNRHSTRGLRCYFRGMSNSYTMICPPVCGGHELRYISTGEKSLIHPRGVMGPDL